MDESCEQSPNTTILKLKKGQRVKDGMILMLSGQVDRRKQLLLGAQVFSSSYSVSDVIILAAINVITFCCILLHSRHILFYCREKNVLDLYFLHYIFLHNISLNYSFLLMLTFS